MIEYRGAGRNRPLQDEWKLSEEFELLSFRDVLITTQLTLVRISAADGKVVEEPCSRY